MTAPIDSYSRLLEALYEEGISTFLVSHPPNLRYLFGFTGSMGLGVVHEERAYLLVDSRYAEQASAEARGCQVRLIEGSYEASLRNFLMDMRISRLGVEARHISFEFGFQLEAFELVSTVGLVERLRMIKTGAEVAAIEDALSQATTAFSNFTKQISPGLTEHELAGLLENEGRRLGSEGTAFPTIVASGVRSSLPHGVASAKRFQDGELLLVDFGFRMGAFCTDLTRVLFTDEDRRRAIHRIVTEARNAALAEIRPGVHVKAIDAAARSVIESHGYGDCFGHGVGHGLGLEVHEAPHISPRGTEVLEENMVFTIEPGIYLPGQFGIRLEDVVAVTGTGYRLLSH